LREQEQQVDLLQCVMAGESEPAILGAAALAVASAGDGAAHPAWTRLHRFCTLWSDPSLLLHRGVREAWLEFDLDGCTPGAPPPSIFFGLRSEVPPDEVYAVVQEALSVLLGESGRTRPALRRCFETGIDGVWPNQVGVMLSRDTDALRLCTQMREIDLVVPFLRRAGWPVRAGELEQLIAEMLHSIGPRVMVAIDVGASVHPKVGLELHLAKQPADQPRWAALFDALVARELCIPAKRDALLAWPGTSVPIGGAVAWPECLIVESLCQPPDRFSTFVRRLYHVKLVYQPEKPLEAKAYLYFLHNWSQPRQARPAGGECL
jgi:hypothetical protein